MFGSHSKSFCRIGVFYDGCYFEKAQRYYYHARKAGWLGFRGFQALVEVYVRSTEQGFASYRVVYAAWFQGMFTVTQADQQHLRSDRNLYHDLMHAGVEPKFLPTSTSGSEKGVDVALAIDALQIGLEDKIDVAVLVSGDADLVPVARALMKQGVRVVAAFFEYKEGDHKSFIDDRLRSACNYEMDMTQLEVDKNFKASFKGCFSPRTFIKTGRTGSE